MLNATHFNNAFSNEVMKTIYLHETVVILFEQLGAEKFSEKFSDLEQRMIKKKETIYFVKTK